MSLRSLFIALVLSPLVFGIAAEKAAPVDTEAKNNQSFSEMLDEDDGGFRARSGPSGLRISERTRSNHLLFHPENYTNLIGFDSTSASLGVLGAQTMVLGHWYDWLGFEVLVGYTKNEDSTSAATESNNNSIANSGTTTTTFSGSKNSHAGSLGLVLKSRIYQNHWMQIYAGGFVGTNFFFKTDYQTGSKVDTFADLANTTNKSVVETNLGSISVERKPQIVAGPKIGAEFYLKWFPHLALGFSTGVATYFGGKTITSSTLRTRTFTVVNGVEQPASADSTKTNSTELTPGIKGVTFGLGGTTFQFTGIFTLRYVW